MRRERFSAIALAILLVATSMTGALGPASTVGNAQAADVFVDCDVSDSLFGALLTGVVGGDGCRLNLAGDYSETNRADLYAGALSINESEDVHHTTTQNRLQDTRAAATTEAKMAVIESLNAGENRTVAAQMANDSVDDYYSTIERNQITQEQATVNFVMHVQSVERAETGSVGNWMSITGEEETLTGKEFYTENKTITLQNGTEINRSRLYVELDEYEEFVTGSSAVGAVEGYLSVHPDNDYDHQAPAQIIVDGPDNETTAIHDGFRYFENFNEIQAQNQQVKANMDAVVAGYYDYYGRGELNTTDVLSPTELFNRASTDHNSTGYYGYAAAELASLGYAGNLNASHTVTYQNETFTGTLFYAGNGSTQQNLTTGQTYNPGNYSGTWVMAYQANNSSGYVDLDDGPFVVEDAVNVRTGESVGTTTTETYVRETTTAEDLRTELEQLRDLRAELEAQEAGGGGSGGGFGDDPQTLAIGALLLVIVGVVISRG